MKPIYLFALFLFALSTQAQKFDEKLTEQLDQQLARYVEEGDPGLAVGVIQNGQTVYQRYLGYADLNHGIKIDAQTRFNIASNAKQFTALCILQLNEQGKLQLDDDIRKYLPDLYPNIEQPITISQLLNHTSGIRDVYDLWALTGKTWWKSFVDNDDAIALISAQQELNFPPGTARIYSNSNYILLTAIVKKIIGEAFEEVSNALFAQLDMPSTGFQTDYMAVVPHKARPYGNWGTWKEFPSITETHGDGALFTTLEDQLQWEKILQQNDGKYLSKTLLAQTQSPVANTTAPNSGFGVDFGTYRDMKYTYHDGSTGAYKATFLRFTEKNLSIVLLTNNWTVPPHYLAQQLADLMFGLDKQQYPTQPNKVEKLADFKMLVGSYQNEAGDIIRIVEKEGALVREMYRYEPEKIINEKGGWYRFEGNNQQSLNFIDVGTPEQTLISYSIYHDPVAYQKLPATNDRKNCVQTDLVGNYYNPETETKIEIQFVEDYTFAITKNGRERKGKLELNDFIRMNSYHITAVRDADGQVIGLKVNNGRIQNVIFERI
ncbi:MAG: serine hydrolase domain-containing protein [Salibacteraceae bacterium]